MEQVIWQGRPSQRSVLPSWLIAIAVAVGLFLVADVAFSGIQRTLPEGAAAAIQQVKPFLVAGMCVIPLLAAWWRSLVAYMTVYTLTSERLERRHGVLSTQTDSVELSRVRDYVLFEPIALRLVGLGNLKIISVDRSIPELTLYAQTDVEKLRNTVRSAVSDRQKALGYREYEVT